MSEQNRIPRIPFNLEAFKSGQKALTRDGGVAKFIAICDECEEEGKLIVKVENFHHVSAYPLNGMCYNQRIQLVSMVSRHQALIDSYDPEDTWQQKPYSEAPHWETLDSEPDWHEHFEYRLHPHNDLIKAYKKGVKIQVQAVDADKTSAEFLEGLVSAEFLFVDDNNPTWGEDKAYRIKPEPTTKTVYEWLHSAASFTESYYLTYWVADEDVEEFFGIDNPKFRCKTGRSWEVKV